MSPPRSSSPWGAKLGRLPWMLTPLLSMAVIGLLALAIWFNVRPSTDPRTLATNLISEEVSLIVDTEMATYEADFVDELPDEPFEITGAVLYPNDGFDLEKLASIKRFNSLAIVSQAEELISLRDFPGHERIRKLEDLALNGFALTAKDLQWISIQESLLSLDLTGCELPENWASVVGQMKNLQLLTLVEVNAQDDDLAKLASLHQLDSLDLSNTRVSGASLATLTSLPITELALTGVELDADFDVTQFAKLRKLYVDGTNFNDAMAEQVDELRLRLIHVGHTGISADGLRALAGIQSLRELDVSGLKIRSEIDAIVSLPQLRHLLADNTDLDDACLEKLSRVEGLKSILVAGTQVTDSGLERFSLRAPSCAVMHDEMDLVLE